MTSTVEIEKIALRAQIKDNFCYVSDIESDPKIAVATHDKLYWVIVDHKDVSEYWFSSRGYKTEEAALRSMAETLSDLAWKKAKKNNITLSK
ncbi:hypothetical protein KCU65_g2774, partial [Aureobasidium melanogenum]